MRPTTLVVEFAAKIVVSSENAEPVALPLAKVKKRCVACVSRLISATLAALPRGTAARRPRTERPTGVIALLDPSAICFCVAGLPSWNMVSGRPVELMTSPIS